MPSEVTTILANWSKGDHSALDELAHLVYRDRYDRARNYLRHERPDTRFNPQP
jgi:hypothetical protein